MALEPFNTSGALTIGVELEIQLIDPTGLDLTDASSDLLHLLAHGRFPGDAKPEITESMIEISTSVHTRHANLLAQLRRMRDALVAAGDRLNVAVCGGGAHPFQRWFRQKIVPRPRFREISELYGYLAKQFTVFGQHVHVGCGAADEALFLLHALNRYVPHFIALSASSPYFQGVDTLFDSSRLNSVFAFPLSGRAPFLLSWREFESGYFAKVAKTGVVHSMKDFYWDIRPKPEFGTIELRVCDTPLTVERAAALACYLQALCFQLLRREDPMPEEDDYLVYNYNRFQACRFGLDGVIVHPKTHEHRSLREDILETLERLRPAAAALESQDAVTHLRDMAVERGNDAAFLRAAFRDRGSLPGSVATAVERFRS
jgi:carboxylate-amine ligase